MVALKVLAIAVACGRVGYVFISGGQLLDWKMSRKAAQSPAKAVGIVQQWINDLKPDVVVTEKIHSAIKKGQRTQEIIVAIAAIAAHNYLLDISVQRTQEYTNKYEEAGVLVLEYPELKPWLPQKRRFFDNEPRTTVLFEALALALLVIRSSATAIAQEMD